MPTIVAITSVIAALSLIATLLVLAEANIAGPIRDQGGIAIGFAIFVFFAALVSLGTCVVDWAGIKKAIHSQYRILFFASATVAVGYCAVVSWLAYVFMHSEL